MVEQEQDPKWPLEGRQEHLLDGRRGNILILADYEQWGQGKQDGGKFSYRSGDRK